MAQQFTLLTNNMSIKIGTQGIGTLNIGTGSIAKVYIGYQLVFSSTPPIPPTPPIPQYFNEFEIQVGKGIIDSSIGNIYTEFEIQVGKGIIIK